jgi:hypothetical protein
MTEFYAKADDLVRCQQSIDSRRPVTVTGIATDGRLATFTGHVEQVEIGHRGYPDYPLRVTMADAAQVAVGKS